MCKFLCKRPSLTMNEYSLWITRALVERKTYGTQMKANIKRQNKMICATSASSRLSPRGYKCTANWLTNNKSYHETSQLHRPKILLFSKYIRCIVIKIIHLPKTPTRYIQWYWNHHTLQHSHSILLKLVCSRLDLFPSAAQIVTSSPIRLVILNSQKEL